LFYFKKFLQLVRHIVADISRNFSGSPSPGQMPWQILRQITTVSLHIPLNSLFAIYQSYSAIYSAVLQAPLNKLKIGQ